MRAIYESLHLQRHAQAAKARERQEEQQLAAAPAGPDAGAGPSGPSPMQASCSGAHWCTGKVCELGEMWECMLPFPVFSATPLMWSSSKHMGYALPDVRCWQLPYTCRLPFPRPRFPAQGYTQGASSGAVGQANCTVKG